MPVCSLHSPDHTAKGNEDSGTGAILPSPEMVVPSLGLLGHAPVVDDAEGQVGGDPAGVVLVPVADALPAPGGAGIDGIHFVIVGVVDLLATVHALVVTLQQQADAAQDIVHL